METLEEINKCTTCQNKMDLAKKEPITVMDHRQMHNYVCSEKCMWDFYK